MEESLKNLQINKKFLDNINSLLHFEPYQNEGMYKLKQETEYRIKELEAEISKLNSEEVKTDSINTQE